MNGSEQVAIIVATQRRPELLRALLEALDAECGSRADIRVVVIDNDPAGSAAAVAGAIANRFSGGLDYALEPQEGYATVRNAGVRAAEPATRLIFIDDDELPEPGWLEALLDAQRRYDADVVAGPAVPVFPADAPRWLIDSGVFTREITKAPSGSSMDRCATRNTLFTRSVYELVPGGFDERFNRTGGEDAYFFFRARLAGARIVWTNEAVVREPVDPQRVSRTWLLRRAKRTGMTRCILDLEMGGTPKAVLTRAAKATGLMGLGIGGLLASLLRRDRAGALRSAYTITLSRGMFAAFWMHFGPSRARRGP